MTNTVTLRAKAGAAPGFAGFFGWLAATHPDLYSRAMAVLPNAANQYGIGASGSHLAGLGDDSAAIQDLGMPDLSQLSQAGSFGITDSTPLPTTSFADTIANTVKSLANTVLPLISQKQILDVQLQRAKNGQPPLDTSAYFANAGMNVGLNSSTQKTFLMMAMIGGAAFVGYSFLKHKR